MDLTTSTPAEIDTALAPIEGRIGDLVGRLMQQVQYRQDHVEGMAKLAAGNRIYSSYSQSGIDRIDAVIAEIKSGIATAKAEAAPLHAEFTRRGGWTRAFLVLTSGKGHVHSSMNCSTCYSTTQYGWLPQVSGHDEAEIVSGAGSDACTVCFPSAPVETAGARTILHSTEVDAQAARDERQAKRDAKAAKAAADALIDPATSKAIRDSSGWEAKEKSATSDYVEAAAYLQAVAEGYPHAGRVSNCAVYVVRFVTAMAAKHGKTEAEVVADLAKKVAARVRRDYA